jgi:xanthine dehydrogenase accessory factor
VRLLETAPEGAFVAIMTRSHALDLDVAAAALLAGRFAGVGLIGSATKRACLPGTVRQIGLGDADLTHLICPAGLTEIRGKVPAAIAAAIAQLLIRRDTAAAATSLKPGAIVPSGAPHA